MGRTHLLLGLNTVWIAQSLPSSLGTGAGSLPLRLVFAALGSLLPDLDAPSSLLQNVRLGRLQPFKLISLGVAPYGHRGLLHSRLGLILLAVLTAPILIYAPGAWVCLLLGFASHLAADACTRGGIRWRFPDVPKSHLLPPRLRLVTGSPPEEGVFALAAVGCLLLFLQHLATALP